VSGSADPEGLDAAAWGCDLAGDDAPRRPFPFRSRRLALVAGRRARGGGFSMVTGT